MASGASLDQGSAELGVWSFPTTLAGHSTVLAWHHSFDTVHVAGSFLADSTRLAAAGDRLVSHQIASGATLQQDPLSVTMPT